MRINGLKVIVKAFWWLLATVFFAFGLIFLLAFYDRYWRWRDCFNELGRCYDPETQQVFLEQAGVAWGSLAAICLIGGLLLGWRALRATR